MGCRLKDLVYLGCLLIMATGVWVTYVKPAQDLGEPWPWTDESAETSRDLLHRPDYEGYFGEGNYEDDGNRGFEEVDDGQYSNDINGESPMVDLNGLLLESLSEDKGTSAQHQDEANYVVPYNEKLIDLKTEVEAYAPDTAEEPRTEENESVEALPSIDETEILLNSQAETEGEAKNEDEDLLMAVSEALDSSPSENNAALEILKNHADKAEKLDLLPDVRQQLQEANTEHHLHAAEEKYKPKIMLRSLDSKQVRETNKDVPKIPRIIHQTWETSDIPVAFVPWIQSWLTKNPSWEYWFWTKEDVNLLIQQNYPTFSNTFSSDDLSVEDRANVMRYFIVHAHGGLYAELDMECLNSMDSWVFSHGCFLAEETREHSYLVHNKLEGNVINALMACKAHHPFYEIIIHALPDYLLRYKGDSSHASGSFFLNDLYQAFRKHPLPSTLSAYGDVALIEPDYFIPRYDERHWRAIDEACNKDIINMPFHVSWLCTLWLRKRMHENQPYKHSYTDHHWIDVAELGQGNVNTISVISVIKDVLSRRQQTQTLPDSETIVGQSPGMNDQDVPQPVQAQLPIMPQEIPQNQPQTGYQQTDNAFNLPPLTHEVPVKQQEIEYPQEAESKQLPIIPKVSEDEKQDTAYAQLPVSQQSSLQSYEFPVDEQNIAYAKLSQLQLIPQNPTQQQQLEQPSLKQPEPQQLKPLQQQTVGLDVQNNYYRLPSILKPQDSVETKASQNVYPYESMPSKQSEEYRGAAQYPSRLYENEKQPSVPGMFQGSVNSELTNLPQSQRTEGLTLGSLPNYPVNQPLQPDSHSSNQNLAGSEFQPQDVQHDYNKDTSQIGNPAFNSPYAIVNNNNADQIATKNLYDILAHGGIDASQPAQRLPSSNLPQSSEYIVHK